MDGNDANSLLVPLTFRNSGFHIPFNSNQQCLISIAWAVYDRPSKNMIIQVKVNQIGSSGPSNSLDNPNVCYSVDDCGHSTILEPGVYSQGHRHLAK